MNKLAKDIALQIKNKINCDPKIAIILGSGLANFADNIKNPITIEYCDLKGMPQSTIKGHKSSFVVGELYDKKVIAMQGRFHLYQNYDVSTVVLPIKIFKELGIETVIITNSCGGLNPTYAQGDFMLIKDHINFTGRNPLISDDKDDMVFLDMSNCYDENYRKIMKNIANNNKISLKEGTYVQVLGPTYETYSESNMYRLVGGDVVGMSTVMESIMAHKEGIKILGLSLVSNMCLCNSNQETNHKEVLKTANKKSNDFSLLLLEFIKRI